MIPVYEYKYLLVRVLLNTAVQSTRKQRDFLVAKVRLDSTVDKLTSDLWHKQLLRGWRNSYHPYGQCIPGIGLLGSRGATQRGYSRHSPSTAVDYFILRNYTSILHFSL